VLATGAVACALTLMIAPPADVALELDVPLAPVADACAIALPRSDRCDPFPPFAVAVAFAIDTLVAEAVALASPPRPPGLAVALFPPFPPFAAAVAADVDAPPLLAVALDVANPPLPPVPVPEALAPLPPVAVSLAVDWLFPGDVAVD
jgi:hypothetical protein